MNSKERLRLFDLHYAKFMSLYKNLSLSQLSLRRASAEDEKKLVGNPTELAAKLEVLDRLIKDKERTTRNPDYVYLKKACESLDRFEKSLQALRRQTIKAYGEIRKLRQKFEERAESI